MAPYQNQTADMQTTEIKLQEFDSKISQLMFNTKVVKKSDDSAITSQIQKDINFLVQQKVKNSLNEKMRLQKI